MYRTQCLILLVLFLPLSVTAADDGEHKEKPLQHFRVEAPTSVAAAREVIDEGIEKISILLKGKPLGVSELEQVHRLTYDLEAAAQLLETERPNAELSALSAVIEKLHLSSERHQEAATLGHFEQLAKEWQLRSTQIRVEP